MTARKRSARKRRPGRWPAGASIRDGGPSGHQPVLLDEAIAALAVRPGGWYVDGTLGLAGHATAVLAASVPDGRLLGIDRDPEARAIAIERLAPFGERAVVVADTNRRIAAICREHGFDPADGVLFDLGVSSLQLDTAGRGFSFRHDAPLDMRMNPAAPLDAAEILNEWPEAEIARVLWEFGDERRSRRIAAAVVRSRPLRTTGELASLVARAAGGGGPIHPATRTFQALRIAVNDELGALEDALEGALSVLRSPGGRLVVISFHSGEDRIVKAFMRRESRDCLCPPEAPECRCGHTARLRSVTRRVVTPPPVELTSNPRSRSAKLRAAERT